MYARFMRYLGTISFAAAVCIAVAFTPAYSIGQQKGTVIRTKAELSPLDQPIAWLAEAKRNYSAVKDYSCVLVSQERVRGKLEEQNIIQLKMKCEPFSVHMRWLAPKKQQNQEVVFVLGKNNNRMRVRSSVLGLSNGGLFWHSIDPNDPRVLQHSRHTILEAGIGNMIDQNLKHWEESRRINNSKVDISESKYNNRDCIRIEVTALRPDASVYCHRSVIFLDKESKLPIRLENYDRPREGGSPGGDLLEEFSYVNLQFNVGLTAKDFDR